MSDVRGTNVEPLIMDERSEAGREPDVDAVERIASMTRQEVDELPYGFVVLDAEGTILLYNRYEARLARLSADRVVGRNFFREVAPCTRVEAFHGRFRALVADPDRAHDHFAFRFHFLHGAQDVTVQLARAPQGLDAVGGDALEGACVFMTVRRRAVAQSAGEAPREIGADVERGRAKGPLGPFFPLGPEQMVTLLDRVGSLTARQLGEEIGRAVAELAGASIAAASTGGPATGSSSDRAAPQLVSGALDEAVSRAGLGRLSIELDERAPHVLRMALVQPSLEICSPSFASLYEGLLGGALSALLDAPVSARWLDERDPTVVPWRFALQGG